MGKIENLPLRQGGTLNRRSLLKGGAALTAGTIIGMPAILKAQDVIRFGHLTPMTGFLGGLGEYAVKGATLAVEEINAAGGIFGRKLEMLAEDSVNPSVAANKAQRLIERDNVELLIGEISSASAQTIAQVATRMQKVFISTGARSDTLRGKNCSRYSFHIDHSNTTNVKAIGTTLLKDGLISGKKIFTLTADYVFGHDLLKAAKAFLAANNGNLVGDELVATDVTDFSPYLLKIRQAKPDVVASNLAGNQVTVFLKQYAEYGLSYPIVGFNLNTLDAWAAGEDNFGGLWPMSWYHEVPAASAHAFRDAFTKKYGKPPENHAWTDYVGMKVLAQTMNEIKSADTAKVIAHLESGAQFDVLKARKGYFRKWDHQLIQEVYSISKKSKGQAKDKWDFLKLGPAVPGANESMEIIATTQQENACTM